MIATGGLLRINARRQDSLRSKPHKPHTHKRKNKKKRRSEVVVVKGKLKLCSVSGFVAALGILVLLVGVVMAALGYWPRDGLFFSTRPQEGAAMASVSSISSTPAPADAQEGEREEEQGGEGDDREQGDESFNQAETVNRTSPEAPQGFLNDFLDRYLYSDRLKVLGPLIMGIGIFLFICANAVLHENRDKKTKVINLRDIYSTVIDLHSLRRPHAPSSANPLNGLVNYVQSKSLETKSRDYPASLINRKEGGGAGSLSWQLSPGSSSRGGGGDRGDRGGDAVFSICQDPASHRLSLPPRFSPPPLSLKKEGLSSFTLPLRHPRPPAPHRRHSAWADQGAAGGEGEGSDRQNEPCPPPPVCSSTPPPARPLQEVPSAASCSSPSLSLALLSCSSLTPSHLSLSSLSHLLSSSLHTPALPCRRRSLPTGSSITGYCKLVSGMDESFETIEMTLSRPVTSQSEEVTSVTSQRRYREKLSMVSQAETG